MLKIHRKITKKNAANAGAGDVNGFLQRIIIEVVTDNYRQMLSEALSNSLEGSELRLDPPLRANERGISGLFASAIGHAASRYRAEARVDRPSLFEEDDQAHAAGGRADYLAWYENRVFGIELKAASMNIENPVPNKTVERRWEKVVKQAKEVQKYLRNRNKEDPIQFPSPISISLFVVVGRRKMSSTNVAELDKELEKQRSDIIAGLTKLGKRIRPEFVASYVFPDTFRVFHPRRKGKTDYNAGERVLYTPFVAFLARSYLQGK